jgi:hypothetical protein
VVSKVSILKSRAGLIVALLGIASGLTPRTADAHPLHTTLSEVTVDQPRHTVRAVVRVFVDDLTAGLSRERSGSRPARTGDAIEARAAAYVLASFSILDRGSKPVSLRSCGVRRNQELLWVCLEGNIFGVSRDLTLRNAVLCDAFSDQVNIVQVGDGTNKRSVLFSRGDGTKRVFSD